MSFEFVETVAIELPDISGLSEFAENEKQDKKLVIEIAAIHAGLTSNFNMYTEKALTEAIASWVQPYPKPIILNHDPLSESVGRVMAAKMDKEEDGTPFTRLQVGITDPEAVSKVVDERYLTGSVGGKCKTANCSICGADWAASESFSLPCKHKRGKVYGGKLAYLELNGITFKEYSFVNMPADERSGLRTIGASSSDGSSDESNDWVKAVKFYSLNMNKESIIELNESGEGVDILSKLKKKDAHFTYMNLKGTFLSMNAYDEFEKDCTDSSEKLTIMQSYTTIDNELEQTDVSGNLEAEPAEENNMSENNATEVVEEQEDDILAVATQLSADLAEQASAEESADEADSKVADEEELSENSDEETDSTEVIEESVEEPVQEEVSTEEEEQLTEKQINAEEQAPEEEAKEETIEVAEESADAVDVNALTSQVEKLTAENAKLKKALHNTLAERVVDAKIACGYIEASDRADALKEHSTRTASSLADSIRDLEKVARESSFNSVNTDEPIDATSLPRVEQKTRPTSLDESGTMTVDSSGQPVKEKQIDPEEFLFDIFMNRK